MIIKTMFVLMLFLNGNVIEFMGHFENEQGNGHFLAMDGRTMLTPIQGTLVRSMRLQ